MYIRTSAPHARQVIWGRRRAERGERDARRARPRRWMWGGMGEEGRWWRIAIPTVWEFKGGLIK